jgi:hypothetical protein
MKRGLNERPSAEGLNYLFTLRGKVQQSNVRRSPAATAVTRGRMVQLACQTAPVKVMTHSTLTVTKRLVLLTSLTGL